VAAEPISASHERQKLLEILASANAGLWEHNIVTGEDSFTEVYASMLGYSVAELAEKIETSFLNIVHPDDHAEFKTLRAAHERGETPTFEAEFRALHKDGQWRWILARGRVGERDRNGKPLHISGIHLDLSLMKQAQEQRLASSETRAAMSTLVASVAHEMATPLGNSLMAASTLTDQTREFRNLLNEGKLKRSEMVAFMENIELGSALVQRNLDRANALIKNLRQVAADQASEQQRHFELAAVMVELLQTLSPSIRRHAHKLVTDIEPGIWMDSQPGPIGQIIVNLVNNAYMHAFDGVAQGVLRISARQRDEWVDIEVRDNGVGIAREHLEQLFKPFFSTKIGQGGTGLGMAIVQNLVTKTLQGSLNVESSPGEGTAFFITLPKSLQTFADSELGTLAP
jgi:PAS domain S-box-containing protein